ncbi:MAG: hypothetical protein RR630_04020 [Coprobacillus sp.]
MSARVVARLNILNELYLPLVKLDGDFITLKGLKAKEELQEAKQGIKKVGGKVIKEVSFTLNDEDDHRCNISIHKIKAISQTYPRPFRKNPL